MSLALAPGDDVAQVAAIDVSHAACGLGPDHAYRVLSRARDAAARARGFASPEACGLAHLRDLVDAPESYDAQGRLRGYGSWS